MQYWESQHTRDRSNGIISDVFDGAHYRKLIGEKVSVDSQTFNPLEVTLGARDHLPRGYIVSSWWVLKQFAPTLPSKSMLGTF